jgi:hypothetical protein
MKKLLFIVLLFAPLISFSQKIRSTELLAGIAINDGSPGYNLSLSTGPQWKSFGMGIYTSFMNTPAIEFSNWTIIGLQMKVRAPEGIIKPYGLFDFGLFNLQTNNDKVNMRTASLDLGAGIDKEMKSGNGLLFDARYKWLVDYGGERETIGVFTLCVGLRF